MASWSHEEETLTKTKTGKWTAGRIKALRARAGLSREAFGAALGISPRTVYRLERGESRPSPLTARALREFAAALSAGA